MQLINAKVVHVMYFKKDEAQPSIYQDIPHGKRKGKVRMETLDADCTEQILFQPLLLLTTQIPIYLNIMCG